MNVGGQTAAAGGAGCFFSAGQGVFNGQQCFFKNLKFFLRSLYERSDLFSSGPQIKHLYVHSLYLKRAPLGFEFAWF